MKRLLSILAVALVCAPLFAKVPNKAVFPDIPGYKTLKGDFHIHTMFSDGTVWPVDRVKEAEYEGLDFLSITDHMETRLAKQLNAGYLDATKVNSNTSYEIAAKYAKGKHITIIHGAEMTRGSSHFPGHFNTHFISDAEELVKVCDAAAEKHKKDKDRSEKDALKAGLPCARNNQNAFIVWNHPQWQKQSHNGAQWTDIQEWAYKNGYMQGIEIVNQDCSDFLDRKGFHWAMERGLTVVSGTDSHSPIYEIVDTRVQAFRPMTLVFATENSVEGIRDALENGRTAVFADNHLYGPEKYLTEMFKAILTITKISVKDNRMTVRVRNDSSLPLEFSKREDTHTDVYQEYNPMRLNRGESASLLFYTCDDGPMPESITVDIIAHNFWCDVDTPIQFEMTFSK